MNKKSQSILAMYVYHSAKWLVYILYRKRSKQCRTLFLARFWAGTHHTHVLYALSAHQWHTLSASATDVALWKQREENEQNWMKNEKKKKYTANGSHLKRPNQRRNEYYVYIEPDLHNNMCYTLQSRVSLFSFFSSIHVKLKASLFVLFSFY